jgi:hypothetical protein
VSYPAFKGGASGVKGGLFALFHLPVQKPSSPISQISLTCGLLFRLSICLSFSHPVLKGEVFNYKILFF